MGVLQITSGTKGYEVQRDAQIQCHRAASRELQPSETGNRSTDPDGRQLAKLQKRLIVVAKAKPVWAGNRVDDALSLTTERCVR